MNSQQLISTTLALTAILSSVAVAGAACPGAGTYTVKGKVTSKASSAAIDGIKVTCQVAGGVAGTAITGQASVEDGGSAEAGVEDAGAFEPGSYICAAPANLAQSGPADVEVKFEDTDGSQNGGEFAGQSKSVEVELNGEATVDVQLDAK
jgi:hypothetical protein